MIRCCWFVAVAGLILAPFAFPVDLQAARWTRTRTLAPARGSDVGACGVAATCAGLAVETRTKSRVVRVRGNDRGHCAADRGSCAKAVCN